MDRKATWWAVTQIKGLGPVRVRRALETLESVEELLERHAAALPFPLSEAEERWGEVQHATERLGGRTLTWEESAYPEHLAHLPDAPPVLYVRGQIEAWKKPMISVVGTRACSDAAARWSYQLGRQLAASGVTVISGLARGIDIAVMRGALDEGGAVVACLAHGIERIHPRGHELLALAMLENGAWVTEFSPYSRVDRWQFAHRNRIVAGMSMCTTLVQSPEQGGSMITARLAVEYDRELKVLTPLDNTSQWSGNRAWIAEGAKGVSTPADVCELPEGRILNRSPDGVPQSSRDVWHALQGSGGMQAERLARLLGEQPLVVRRQLMLLELGGWVRRSPGGGFVPVASE